MGALQSVHEAARTARVLVLEGVRPSRILRAAIDGNVLRASKACRHTLVTLGEPMNLDGDTVFHLAIQKTQAAEALAGLKALVQHLLEAASSQPKQLASLGVAPGEAVPDVSTVISALINTPNYQGETPLHRAAFFGKDLAVSWLLKEGADAWMADQGGGRTPLHLAVVRGHVTCIQLLCSSSPPARLGRNPTRLVDVRTSSGFTPLHYAVAHNLLPAVRMLLVFSPDLDARNHITGWFLPGSTPANSTVLHIAAWLGFASIARAILIHYAERSHRPGDRDPRTLTDGNGRTAAQLAAAKGHRRLAALLEPTFNLRSLVPRLDSIPEDSQTLAALAATALRLHLSAQLRAATAAAAALQSQQQSGKRFGRALRTRSGSLGGMWGSPHAGQAALMAAHPPPHAADLPPLLTASRGPPGLGSPRVTDVLQQQLQQPSVTAGGAGVLGNPPPHVVMSDGGLATGRSSSLTPTPVLPNISDAGVRRAHSGRPPSIDGAQTQLPGSAVPPPRSLYAVHAPPPLVLPASTQGEDASLRHTLAAVELSGGGAGAAGAGLPSGRTPRGVDASYSRRSSHSSAVGDPTRDGRACGVCWDSIAQLCVAGCGHAICSHCAAQLIQGIRKRPLTCPFCRGAVRGFAPYVPGDAN